MSNEQPPQRDWQLAHEELSRLAKARAHLDWKEGALLLRALRAGVHSHLGFGSFREYVERLFGYKPRWTEERLRVAEALEGLPTLGESLRDGSVNWSAARELTRVATPENEQAWLQVARGRTVRQIEELVAGHKPGDAPNDGYDASLRKHVLRFEVSAETAATFGDAMASMRRAADSSLDDDAVLLLLARQFLGGPRDAGRASYQVAVTTCEGCGRGWQQGHGEQLEVGSDVVEMAGCDAQRLTHVGTAIAPDAMARQEPSKPESRARRARQDVPPAVRRNVMRRDGGQCMAPGCRHATFLDLHHLLLRSEGGDHDPDTLVVLCGAHHRAAHHGTLIIEGRVSTGLVFRHADGTKYGDVASSRMVAVHAEAFAGLRSLGFRELEVRGALARIRAEESSVDDNVERVLRKALDMLSGAPAKRLAFAASHSTPIAAE
jgi:hypothetical protein